jgi:hypothetical protein
MSDVHKEMAIQIENDHKALHASLDALSTAFDKMPADDAFFGWKLKMLWQLRDFHNQLQKHFDLEEHGGYNAELTRMAPQLLPQIEHLEEDHLKISSDLCHIVDVLKGIYRVDSAKMSRVGDRTKELIQFIRDHEAAEHAIIQEAYYQDYGVGD